MLELFTNFLLKICVPVFYVFMENRTRQLYDRVFEQIANMIPNNCNISFVTTDFELAAMRSISSIQRFAQAAVKGCYFHLKQSLWRKIQEIGASNLYANNREFAINCRMLAALAFAPIERVNAEF